MSNTTILLSHLAWSSDLYKFTLPCDRPDTGLVWGVLRVWVYEVSTVWVLSRQFRRTANAVLARTPYLLIVVTTDSLITRTKFYIRMDLLYNHGSPLLGFHISSNVYELFSDNSKYHLSFNICCLCQSTAQFVLHVTWIYFPVFFIYLSRLCKSQYQVIGSDSLSYHQCVDTVFCYPRDSPDMTCIFRSGTLTADIILWIYQPFLECENHCIK